MAAKSCGSKEAPAAEWVRVADLRPWKRNPRRNEHVVSKLAAAIRTYGFGSPLVAQASTRRLVAGHTRRLAVLELLKSDSAWTAEGAPGPGYLPVRLLDCDDATATALALADNNRALQGEWDDAALLAVLGEARQAGTDALAAAGWDDALIGGMLDAAARVYSDETTDTIEAPPVPDEARGVRSSADWGGYGKFEDAACRAHMMLGDVRVVVHKDVLAALVTRVQTTAAEKHTGYSGALDTILRGWLGMPEEAQE